MLYEMIFLNAENTSCNSIFPKLYFIVTWSDIFIDGNHAKTISKKFKIFTNTQREINANLLKRQNSMGCLRNMCNLVKSEGRDDKRK